MTSMVVVGSLVGSTLAQYVLAQKLRIALSGFVVLMATYIAEREAGLLATLFVLFIAPLVITLDKIIHITTNKQHI